MNRINCSHEHAMMRFVPHHILRLTQVIEALFCSKKTGLGDALSKALHYFKGNAWRVHPKRDWLYGRLKIGLVPYFGNP